LSSQRQVVLNSFSSHRGIVVISLLLTNFVVFNATQSTPDPDGDDDNDTIWGQPGQTQLWPSIVASISHFFQLVPPTKSDLFDELVILILYIASVKWANRLATVRVSVTVGTIDFPDGHFRNLRRTL